VGGPIDIMRMVLVDGRGVSEEAALMEEEEEEGPEEDKVRNVAWYGHTPLYCTYLHTVDGRYSRNCY